MRFFDEETGGTVSKDTLVLMSREEATFIVEALTEYVNNNKRKVKVKKLLKEMDSKWCIY